jgi:hypothetical protein
MKAERAPSPNLSPFSVISDRQSVIGDQFSATLRLNEELRQQTTDN